MSCGITESFNQLAGETIVEIKISGVNAVYVKTASEKYFSIFTLCVNSLGIHGMEVTETESDYETPKAQ